MMHRLISFARLVALSATIAIATAATTLAQDAQIALHVGKVGFIIGGSGGNGTLTYQGNIYPLTVSGMSVGLTIGVASADMVGTVHNLANVSDIEGVYAAAGASAAAGGGAVDMVLENSKGVKLQLTGKQMGIEASLATSGFKIKLK